MQAARIARNVQDNLKWCIAALKEAGEIIIGVVLLKRLSLLVLFPLVLALGGVPLQSMSVNQLVSFVQSSIKMHTDDRQLADYLLHQVKLTERLDDRTTEELQGLGAGPKTVAALHTLRDNTEKLPDPAPPAPKKTAVAAQQAPPPDSVEQARILDAAREYALNYTHELPNFLCLEAVKRSIDKNLKDEPGDESWQGSDSFIARVSYNDSHEDYKVVSQGSKQVNDLDIRKMGGAVSQGEFGSMMREVFEPSSEARFDWDHWGTLRGAGVYVFRYDIDLAHSRFSMQWENDEPAIFAYRGKVFIDRATDRIVRITQIPYNMPSSYPVKASETVLDYTNQKIEDREFLLPAKVVWISRNIRSLNKNEVDFRLYKKFGADTTIKFEEMNAPLSDDQLKEKKP
jgi:hypothetical protein